MAIKQFCLVVVRHGQATHNLETFNRADLVMTDEPVMPFMNSPLTTEGRQQAGMVARRLQDTKFDLGLASDLVRAWDTAQAIVQLNPSLQGVEECRLLRERNAGVFDGDKVVGMSQWAVEEAIEDRELLTWRIPEGESVVDLRNRAREFLELVQSKALALEAEHPTILVATHYVWMHEFYRILAEQCPALGASVGKKPRTPNTGVDQYTLTTEAGQGGQPHLRNIAMDVISCGKHLEDGSGYSGLPSE